MKSLPRKQASLVWHFRDADPDFGKAVQVEHIRLTPG